MFYQGLELATLNTIPMPRTGLFRPTNDFEAQQMFSTDLALLGLSVYSGGLATQPRVAPAFTGFSSVRSSSGIVTAPGGPLAMNGAKIEFLTEGQIARIQGWASKRNTEVTLFGSRAKGTAHALSDWDFFIEANYKLRSKARFELPRGPANSGRNRIDVIQPSAYPEFYRKVLEQPHIIFKPN